MFAIPTIPAKINHLISMDLGWSRILRDNGTFGAPVADKFATASEDSTTKGAGALSW